MRRVKPEKLKPVTKEDFIQGCFVPEIATLPFLKKLTWDELFALENALIAAFTRIHKIKC